VRPLIVISRVSQPRTLLSNERCSL